MKLAPYYEYLDSAQSRLLPKTFQINLTNKCYSKCIGCRKYEWPDVGLSFSAVIKILDSMGSGMNIRQSVILSGGEPTMHPDFNRICKHASAAAIDIGVLTSGLFNLDNIDFSHVNWAAISIDGSTSEKYRATRGVDGLNTVINNITKLQKLYPNLKLRCNSTISVINFEDILEILELCESLSIDCYFYPMHTWHDLQISDALLTATIIKDLYDYNSSVKTNINEFLSLLNRKKPANCIVPHFHAFIDSDGEVFPCCRLANDNGHYDDRNMNMSYGNIYDTEFNKLIYCDTAYYLRQILLRSPNEKECYYCDRYNKVNANYTEYLRYKNAPLFL